MNVKRHKTLKPVEDTSLKLLASVIDAGYPLTPEIRQAVAALNCAVARADRRERERR